MTITQIPTDANENQPQYDLGAALSSYSLQEGGIEPGDYDSYVGLIDRATLQRMNSPDDFFAEAKFPSDEYGDVVLGYYELGMETLFAACNNRLAEIQYLNDALVFLDKCEERSEIIEDDKVSVLVKAELQLNFRRGSAEWNINIPTTMTEMKPIYVMPTFQRILGPTSRCSQYSQMANSGEITWHQ